VWSARAGVDISINPPDEKSKNRMLASVTILRPKRDFFNVYSPVACIEQSWVK
jgi:hypothetical protein